jgi:tetratricopeptide (TPR) repeat protein
LVVLVAVVTGVGADVSERVGHINTARVLEDQRWSQWKDGFRTAIAYLPSGSGLGSYGYASLPFQSEPRGFWFREAHNQYLEVLVESGVIGFSILAMGLFWFARHCILLVRSDRNIRGASEARRWGLLGLAILIAAGLQSCVDFVIAIPANLLLYAVMIGIICSIRSKPTTDPLVRLPYRLQIAATMFICVAFLVFAYQCSDEALQRERSQSHGNGDPWLQARKSLDLYRGAVVDHAASLGTVLSLDQVKTSNMSALILQASPPQQEMLRRDLLGNEKARQHFQMALEELELAKAVNPMQARTHLELAYLAVISDKSMIKHLDRAIRLSNNHIDRLFDTGLLAYYANDQSRMLAQWSKCLKLDHRHLEKIHQLAQTRTTVDEFYQYLVPVNRPDVLVKEVEYRIANDAEFGASNELAQLIQKVDQQQRFVPERQHRLMAQLLSLANRPDQSIDHWEMALRETPMNTEVRYQLSVSLDRNGKLDEALKHAILGQHLFPNEPRFERLAKRIRKQLAASSFTMLQR